MNKSARGGGGGKRSKSSGASAIPTQRPPGDRKSSFSFPIPLPVELVQGSSFSGSVRPVAEEVRRLGEDTEALADQLRRRMRGLAEGYTQLNDLAAMAPDGVSSLASKSAALAGGSPNIGVFDCDEVYRKMQALKEDELHVSAAFRVAVHASNLHSVKGDCEVKHFANGVDPDAPIPIARFPGRRRGSSAVLGPADTTLALEKTHAQGSSTLHGSYVYVSPDVIPRQWQGYGVPSELRGLRMTPEPENVPKLPITQKRQRVRVRTRPSPGLHGCFADEQLADLRMKQDESSRAMEGVRMSLERLEARDAKLAAQMKMEVEKVRSEAVVAAAAAAERKSGTGLQSRPASIYLEEKEEHWRNDECSVVEEVLSDDEQEWFRVMSCSDHLQPFPDQRHAQVQTVADGVQFYDPSPVQHSVLEDEIGVVHGADPIPVQVVGTGSSAVDVHPAPFIRPRADVRPQEEEPHEAIAKLRLASDQETDVTLAGGSIMQGDPGYEQWLRLTSLVALRAWRESEQSSADVEEAPDMPQLPPPTAPLASVAPPATVSAPEPEVPPQSIHNIYVTTPPSSAPAHMAIPSELVDLLRDMAVHQRALADLARSEAACKQEQASLTAAAVAYSPPPQQSVQVEEVIYEPEPEPEPEVLLPLPTVHPMETNFGRLLQGMRNWQSIPLARAEKGVPLASHPTQPVQEVLWDAAMGEETEKDSAQAVRMSAILQKQRHSAELAEALLRSSVTSNPTNAEVQTDLPLSEIIEDNAPAEATPSVSQAGAGESSRFQSALATAVLSIATRLTDMDSRAMGRAAEAERFARESQELSRRREAEMLSRLEEETAQMSEQQAELRRELHRVREKARLLEEQSQEAPVRVEGAPPPAPDTDGSEGLGSDADGDQLRLNISALPLPPALSERSINSQLSEGQVDVDAGAFSDGEEMQLTPRGTHTVEEGERVKGGGRSRMPVALRAGLGTDFDARYQGAALRSSFPSLDMHKGRRERRRRQRNSWSILAGVNSRYAHADASSTTGSEGEVRVTRSVKPHPQPQQQLRQLSHALRDRLGSTSSSSASKEKEPERRAAGVQGRHLVKLSLAAGSTAHPLSPPSASIWKTAEAFLPQAATRSSVSDDAHPLSPSFQPPKGANAPWTESTDEDADAARYSPGEITRQPA
jgi:hypothetical protein